MLRLGTLALVFATAACGGTSTTAAPDDPGATNAAPATTQMSFSGFYDVPVPSDLTAAATYATPEVHWTVANGVARLEYDLPPGLVGGEIEVLFTGPFDPNATKQLLTGPAGTAECTVTATSVSCFEAMHGLLPINPDLGLVEAIAKQSYAGPAEDRLNVTRRFIGDPLGIVRFELSTGVVDADPDVGGKKRKGKDKDD